MDLDLTSGKLWLTVILGAVVLGAVSTGFHKANAEDSGEELNVKGIVRDGILGGIFVAMAWTLIPESMTTLSDKVTSSVAAVATTATSSVSKASEFELQIGPPRF
jgi:hypothetical protein